MYGIKTTEPGLREVLGLSSGQRHDKVILFFTVDWCQVGSIKLTVNLQKTKEEHISFIIKSLDV